MVVAARQGTSCSGCLCSRQQVSGKSTKSSGREKYRQQGTPPPEQPGRHTHLDHKTTYIMSRLFAFYAASLRKILKIFWPRKKSPTRNKHQQGPEQPGRPAHLGHKKMLEMDQPCALGGRQLHHKNCNPLET